MQSDPVRWPARLAGGVLSWFGVALLVLTAVGLLSMLRYPAFRDAQHVALAIGGLVLGLTCSVAGFRMFLDRPNRFGSAMAPAAWWALAVVFAFLALFIAITFARGLPVTFDGVVALVGCACLAVLSFLAGRRAAKSGGRSRPVMHEAS